MANIKVPLTFRIFQGDKLLREDKLSQGVIKLGKVPSAHLRLDDETVSRMHAIIEVTSPDDISIIDLGSTRGTFVNGQRINKAKLTTGDWIQVGDSRIEFAVDAPVAEVVQAPTPLKVVAPPPVPAVTPPPPPPMPAIAKPVAPVMAARVSIPLTPSPVAAAFQHEIDDAGGARSVEVAAMLGDSVVDVKHCLDPHSGKVSRTTWAVVAAGAVSLLASGIAFAISIHNAKVNEDALETWKSQGKPETMFHAHNLSFGFDWLAFGGLALGLGAVTAALARARAETRSPYYRIGTASGVEMAVEHAPTDSFPLVAPSGDDFVFNYANGIVGELIVDGHATPLAELLATGQARPSTTTAGAIEVPIPAKARIRARAGNTTFLVSAVARPRRYVTPAFAGIEGRALAYLGGSAMLHLGIWGLLQMVPVDDGSIAFTLDMKDDVATRASITAMTEAPPPPPDDKDDGDNGGSGGGQSMQLPSGTAGKPDATSDTGHLRIAKTSDNAPALSRAEAIERARTSGFLGADSELFNGISAIVGTEDRSNGLDSTDVWGPIYGAEGEGRGTRGFGMSGNGFGGGCSMPPCGIIGSGGYNTIGRGPGTGEGYGPGHAGGWGHGRHPQTPPVVIGQPSSGGGLDKSIIRRYVKRNEEKISYCYGKELLAHPNLEGEVMVQFMIAPDGTVQASNGRGFDTNVATCVASVVHGITFPRPTDNGPVQVNYPFTFHHRGG